MFIDNRPGHLRDRGTKFFLFFLHRQTLPLHPATLDARVRKAQLQWQDVDALSHRLLALLKEPQKTRPYLERLIVKVTGRVFFLNEAEVACLMRRRIT
jgi:hypothetical protein